MIFIYTKIIQMKLFYFTLYVCTYPLDVFILYWTQSAIILKITIYKYIICITYVLISTVYKIVKNIVLLKNYSKTVYYCCNCNHCENLIWT